MVVCVRCGSLRTTVISGGILGGMLALVLRQDVIACARCGFRGRQPKPAAGRGTRTPARDTASAETGIDLKELDRVLERDPGKPSGKGKS